MNSPVYDVLLVAHVLSAVIGFGALAATGSFAAGVGRAGDPRSSAALRTYFRPGRNWAGRVLFAVPLFGAALLATGDHAGAGQAWPWIGLGIWLVAAYLATSRLWPAEREIQQLLGETSPVIPTSGAATPPPTRSQSRAATPPVARSLPSGRGGAPALTRACARAERAAAATSVCFVAALAVMVIQPH